MTRTVEVCAVCGEPPSDPGCGRGDCYGAAAGLVIAAPSGNPGNTIWARLTKREPERHDVDWDQRTYPCNRWFCFRRSPAWRSFSRAGKSYCDRHAPRRNP